MKKIILPIISLYLGLGAQTLSESLAPECQKVDTAHTVPVLYMESAKFDLIASKYPNEWAANYYAAFSKAKLSYMEQDVKKKDLILDQADKYLEKLLTLPGDSCENHVISAMLANARLAVDGQNRWKKYGELFNDHLNKAKKINENNPRIYYLKGASVFYTPKMFGGGAKNAKEYFEKAKMLYEKESKANPLVPFWGEPATTYFLGECNKQE